MTVANIPMVSALARSMPISLATAPRKILPPPTTMARSQPISFTSLISWAKALTVLASMPKLCAPANISPVTFRRIRLYLGVPLFMKGNRCPLVLRGRFAEMIASKTAHLNILAEASDGFVDHIQNFLIRLLDESLFKQTNFGIKLIDLALDDFLDDLFRFARLERLLAVDCLFLVNVRCGHFLAPHATRIRRRHLHGDIFQEGLEFR